MPKARGTKQIAANRKAFHEYFVDERYEAGISLCGTEVKSIRAGAVNLKDSYCDIKNGELFVIGMHVSPYEKGNIFNHNTDAVRKLLLHKKEILKLSNKKKIVIASIAIIQFINSILSFFVNFVDVPYLTF